MKKGRAYTAAVLLLTTTSSVHAQINIGPIKIDVPNPIPQINVPVPILTPVPLPGVSVPNIPNLPFMPPLIVPQPQPIPILDPNRAIHDASHSVAHFGQNLERSGKQTASTAGTVMLNVADNQGKLSNDFLRFIDKSASSVGGNSVRDSVAIFTDLARRNVEYSQAFLRVAGNVLTGKDLFRSLYGSLLAQEIRIARETALAKSKPIPDELRLLLAPFYDSHDLARARYVSSWAGLSVPNAIRTCLNDAVTLDDVIIFPSEPDIHNLDGVTWWAHELQHVSQYSRMGIDDFAAEYTVNSGGLEGEAHAKAREVAVRLLSVGFQTAGAPPDEAALKAISRPPNSWKDVAIAYHTATRSR